ncbi:MAG: hypothetical protein GYA43_03150 [Bacteroidales bacterium]|nr:hypothetical protein [Bacteroidales bacterium]
MKSLMSERITMACEAEDMPVKKNCYLAFMKLFLSKLHWYCKSNTNVTGFILSGEKFLREEALSQYFSELTGLADFEERLKTANGQFSVVIDRGDEIWAATDRTRNWPLFYTRIDGRYYLSDDCYKLAELRKENEFDAVSYNCFLTAGYTINDRTLLKDIFQVEAGTITILGKEATTRSYHDPIKGTAIITDMENASGDLTGIMDTVFREYFTALKDKFIAIPLSGGYDSRLVALMASKYHPENILCYTYGRADNREVPLAMEVAKRLKIRWINIEYNKGLVRDYIRDEYFSNYYTWVSNLTGMFFLQEYFAVRYLKQKKLIPGNTVFISGYSGDFIAGSYLTPVMKRTMKQKEIARLICREYFRLVDQDRLTRKGISDLIGERIPSGKSEAWKVIESWDLKERHAKFIVNSAKVFTFFGYDYAFPLWDNRLVDFMLPLPFDLRMDRRLYEHVLRDRIFRENDLNLPGETNPTPAQKSFQRFKESIKHLLPSALRNLFIDPYNAIFYDEITKILREDMDKDPVIPPRQSNYYNSYIIQWYLSKKAEQFSLDAIK